MISAEISEFLRVQAVENFLRYVQIYTTSDHDTGTHPSTERQRDLAKILKEELETLGLQSVVLDEYCYVYAVLPATPGCECPPITFCSHMDTSPSEPGHEVKPIVHANYDGKAIFFPDNPDLSLTPDESPELAQFIGENIITASGTTLLGADDKAGLAEIMAALAAIRKFDLPHPELRIAFTPDEEIGQGTVKINLERLGEFAYTLDGGMMGSLEAENFYAHGVRMVFHGNNVHPGYAKNRMVNATAIASRFVAALPEHDSPEHAAEREGFIHLTLFKGDENLAELKFILRDFDRDNNLHRIELFEKMKETFQVRYPGLKIDLIVTEQYKNMHEILRKHPLIVEKAEAAIKKAGLEPIRKPVRGGTDGARLTFMGVPTPNLFTGGLMFHSKKEWIPEIALQKAAEVVVHLCQLWAEE